MLTKHQKFGRGVSQVRVCECRDFLCKLQEKMFGFHRSSFLDIACPEVKKYHLIFTISDGVPLGGGGEGGLRRHFPLTTLDDSKINCEGKTVCPFKQSITSLHKILLA